MQRFGNGSQLDETDGLCVRILMTADAVGGVWQYGIELAGALAAFRIETVLAVLGPGPSPAQLHEGERVPNLEVTETGLPLDWLSEGPGPVIAAGEAIAAMAEERRVDLVHLNMPSLNAFTHFTVPTVAVAHGCVSTWWEAAYGTPLQPNYHWQRVMMRRGLIAADRVAAPSAAFAATLVRHYALPRHPQVVHNGRSLSKRGAAPCGGTHVFTAGRLWDRVKNTETLDQVAERLPVPFLAAGPVRGPHGETARLRHLVAVGCLSSAEIGQELAGRPVFVSGARFEPFGLAVLEAAAAGCPLVLSDIPTFRELWDDAAIFVSSDDVAAYTEAIGRLLDDPPLRDRLGVAAATRSQRYTPGAMGAAMRDIYRGAITASRNASGGGEARP